MARPDDPDDISPDHACEGESILDKVARLPAGDRSLAGTMRQGGNFMFAELAGVDLTQADFYWASFRQAVLEATVMTRCDLRGASFHEANLRHADLGADLRNADLGGADFTHARLIGTDLSGARAISTIPSRPTRFQGANLTDARRRGARLTGALYDGSTAFPRGFTPEGAGMVFNGRKSRARSKPRHR